jgi:Flp pilus assembly protein TadD
MTKVQWRIITAAAGLFGLLFWGFDTKPDKHISVEKQRALSATSTDVGVLLEEAKKGLSAQQMSVIMALELETEQASADSVKSNRFKRLSSAWYEYENPAIAGYFAEKAAEIENSEEAWSISGTTYSICLQKEKSPKIRSYCTERAVQALEKATSLNPSNLQHKINLALVYAENPPPNNPMKGVLMLVDLNKTNPKNASVLTQLGRLAIKTSQYDKAVERLQGALAVEPENTLANCLLVKAYRGLGDEMKAKEFESKCSEFSN